MLLMIHTYVDFVLVQDTYNFFVTYGYYHIKCVWVNSTHQ